MTLEEAAARVQSAAIGALKQRQKDRIARKHRPKIAAFFRSQKRQVLDALAKQEYLFAESYRRILTEDTTQLTLAQWERIWDEIAADSLPELQKVVLAAEVDGVEAGAAQLQKQIGLFDKTKSFNLANPRAVDWFRSTGGSVDYIKGINHTTGNQVRTVIASALDTGKSYSTTAKDIRVLFDGMSRERAQRIAVFESGKSYEAGNRIYADVLADEGIRMEQSWQTSKDEKVRPEHTANEAEGWVPLGHVFVSGDMEPPTDPGCRCYMTYRQAPK